MNQCDFCLQLTKDKLVFAGESFSSVCHLCYREKGYVGQCAVCLKPMSLSWARTTIFDVLICKDCADKLWPIYYYKPPPTYPNEVKFRKLNKLFCQKKLWTEVQCQHISSDGCVTKQPLTPKSKFYKV